MAHVRYTYIFETSIEHEIKWAGRYGAKGEKRAKKEKPSPEQIAKQNQINRGIRMRRLIKANFSPGDLWITLKYPAGTKKPPWRVKKDFANFIDKLRRVYRKRGHPLKWIRRIEIGARGGIHIHVLLGRLPEGDTDLVVQQAWTHGHTYYASIYYEGGYEQLAEYIVKMPEEDSEEYEQISMFDEEDQKTLISYSCSRNMVRPVPEKKEYKTRTVRKMIEQLETEGTVDATPGYYVDRDSIRAGVNPYTGMSYLYYTEYKLERTGPPERRQI